MKTWNVSEEALLSTYLTNRVCERAAGQIDPECLNNMPSDTYFIGNLRPVSEDDDNTPRYLRDLRNKLSPMAFGAEFRVLASEREITVQVYVSWNCYYRVFPTLLQQQEHQLREYRQDQNTTQNQVTHESVAVEEGDDLETEEDDTASSDEQFLSRDDDLSPLADEDALIESRVPHKPKSKRRSSTPKDSLAARFKKIECSASGTIRLWFDSDLGRWWSDCATLQDAINNEIERAQTLVASDPETLRIGNDDTSYIKVSESSLTNEETYRAFCASFPNVLVPDWALECKAESTSSTPEAIVLITFSNTSNVPLKGKNIEPYLFAVRAAFGFIQGQPKPFELELVPRSFRYDRTLQARGFNCAVEVDYEQGLYFTSNTPVHTQGRYSTRTEPPAPFVDLATDPLPILDAILAAMNQHLMEWDEAALDYAAKYHDWDQTYSSEFTRDRDLYVDEIRRFERGVELIRESADIELAFRLTNQTFLEAGTARGRSTKTKTSWRLFQIVFLVSQIPGITALTNPESRDALERSIVDIIYFPTGGGKTEAYLSVIVFHCFFDRLRGKTAGVTAWTRFPLRLLTLQQTQRVADVIGIADLIRKDHVDPRLSGKKVAGFAVGYLAGKEATPNELKEPGQGQPPDADWSKALDNRFRQRWKKVITCPSCGTQSVIVDFDHTKARVYHRCTNDDCRFDSGRIPVYVIDNEIYRYLPSVIVGTIDKLASVGNQRKLALVFGQVDGVCPKHGYYKGECCQKGCNEQLRIGIPEGLSGPTLFVQDELHLLKEGLGTFDAHYETFAQELLRLGGQALPLKIIASSATIEAFERQVEHLYGRSRVESRIFPGTGITLSRSFYAETVDQPQRIFVGIIPHNKTLFNAVLELIQYYHEAIQDLQRLSTGEHNPYSGAVLPGTPAWYSLVDYYATSLTYFISNRDLNSLRTDLDTVVSENLQRQGYTALQIAELTGATSSEDVTRILEQLEQPLPTQGNAPTTVLATSMVSHGVDVDRFNAMFFYGMPRQNAEYIQASSRVGRSNVGIVFNCLSPARERDQSHYAYFSKFHEFLGRLVEPVAINRWSKFSIRRTMPGLFMGILLQLLANRPGVTKPGRYYTLTFIRQELSSGRLRIEDFVPLLTAAYRVENPVTVGEHVFSSEIRSRIPIFVDQIIQASNQYSFVSEALKPFGPMNSLREVDEELAIELSRAGRDWGNTAGRQA